MPTLNQVRGLPQIQACEALAVSRRLTDAEVFLLMGCVHVGKSPELRVFWRGTIERRPSIARPLQEAGTTAAGTIESLIGKRFLLKAGLGKVQTSQDADIVRHRFTILQAHLRLRGTIPATGNSPSHVPILCDYMRRVCDGIPF